MKERKIPRSARHLHAYSELRSYQRDFVAGRYPFMWIIGRTGVGKTESMQAEIRGHKVYYQKGAQVTPLQLYIDCYRHRGEPIILDDAEHLLDNRIGAKLISALGDTGVTKQLSYATTGRALGRVQQSYFTTSPLCIISNRVTVDEAILSRPVVLYFDPSNAEIHREVVPWYWNQTVHDWMGVHLTRLGPIDTRWYVIADRDMRGGRDWQRIILKAHALDMASCVVQDLQDDPAFPTQEDKARRYAEIMGGATGVSRASYFRICKRLRDSSQLTFETCPSIRLQHRRPPGTPSQTELDAMEASSPPPTDDTPPADLPASDAFQQPIRGQGPSQTQISPFRVDDTVLGEDPPNEDEEDE
jgi:hypothetical protein